MATVDKAFRNWLASYAEERQSLMNTLDAAQAAFSAGRAAEREDLAARQPVGPGTPYGYISPEDLRRVKRHRHDGIACAVPINLRISDEDMPEGCEPLYTAPPHSARGAQD